MNRIVRDDALPALPGAPRRIPTAAAASAALLRPVTESTAGLPAHEQFAAWRAMRAPIIETLPGPGAEQGFAATAAAWRIGGFIVEHTLRPACGYRRTPAQIRRDSLDHWLIAICRRGACASAAATRTPRSCPARPSSSAWPTLSNPSAAAPPWTG